MAVNDSRSMNGDLALGIADGTTKHSTPDRGGVVSSTGDSVAARGMLAGIYDAMESKSTASAVARRITHL